MSMKTADRRICPRCGSEFLGAIELCPICMFRGALEEETEALSEQACSASVLEAGAERFEHFEVFKGEDGRPVELGRGAMGITYKALDVDLRCPVALKVISERYLGDESARLRFLREARAAASVRHSNVASVFHLGRSAEGYFYAMEFVEGETLENVIKRSGRLDTKVALEIAAQVAAGLAAVHKKGLVHRDIKPSNIMVSLEEGVAVTAKIIDLGLAKGDAESPADAAISVPGVFAGTPAFASPEQFAGAELDIRSDLYSLGVTLWKMLTGQVPFQGPAAEVMRQHQRAALPLEQLEGIPQPLAVLLEVFLEKDPARRFQSPAEVLKVMPMVRDAMEAGSLLTKTIRVFISSTGDVQKERILADRVIRSIAAEFGVPVSALPNFERLAEDNGEPENHAAWLICPYFLEYQKLQPGTGFRGQMPMTVEFGLVISIVWSRLGALPDPSLTLPDGSVANSGTEYEVAWALDHAKKNRGLPLLHVYRNCSRPTPPLEECEVFIQQWNSLQEFFARWEENSEGNIAGACSEYRDLQEFEELFREHFRDFLTGQVERESGQEVSGRKVRRWKSSPFRGLNFFDFEHAPIFHGRTKAIGEVLEALEAQARAQRPFVLVVGASGSGKSSLVRAGVLPLLTQPETVEGIGLWRRSVTRPGAGGSGGDCFDALAAALLEPSALPALQDSESQNAIRDLATELREHSDAVALRVRDALDHAAREWKMQQSHSLKERERQLRESGRLEEADLARQRRESLELPKARLALVIDQLEELFTTGFSLEVRQKYIAALAGLVRSGRVFVLATLRSDFYPRYQEFPDLIELAKPSGKLDLRPPTAYELGNMIRLPAEAAGMRFEQKRESGQRLDQALRDAAAVTPESLPLLEHVLSLLYEQQGIRGDNLLRWSDYEEVGELRGALAKHAEAVFSMLRPHEQSAFPLVMRYLVTLSQGEEEVPNGRTVPYRDLVSSESDDDQKAGAKDFVDLFIEKRLLVADTDPQGEVTVRVAHEALLREWRRVKEWLTENREFLRMRDRLDASLKLWLSRGKQKDDLLEPGLHLAEGEKLVKDFGPSLSREQIDYVSASIVERNRRKQAHERIRYAVMAAITVLAVVAGFQWFRAERQRQSAAQALKSEAQVTAKLHEQLQQASWASFNQAERQFQLGEWREGIALLARAIKFDPQNQVASEQFFHELIMHREKAPPPLIASFQHQDKVHHAAFSPDAARILTASWDKTAKLWDAASGKLIASFDHQGWIWHAEFSPDGARILTASADKTAKLWDAASGELIASFAHNGAVTNAVFSPDGTRILTASADRTAKLWDAASGKLIASFDHQGWIAVFSPDGARILTASADNTAKLWDAASGELLASFAHQDTVEVTAFSPDGARILTASADNTAKLWDVASGKVLFSFAHDDFVHHEGVKSAFSPDGARILTASWETAKLWDAASGKLIASFAHEDGVYHAAFSPDGARILTASADKTAKLWDAASGELIGSFAHQQGVQWAGFSPNGARILTASYDKTAKLWDAASAKPIASFGHRDGLWQAAFSPDGTRILTASADKSARLWDAGSGKVIASFAHEDTVEVAAFSLDGARILTASADKTTKLWDAASGKLVASFDHQDAVSEAAFSPDGARILTASVDKTAKLWDAASGELVASFDHQDAVYDAALSLDGTRVLTASADNTAKLWDAASGKPVASFDHQGAVYGAAFSPDGARILTASADTTAKLWDAASGELIVSLDHQDEVTDVAFSPDGARILTASADKTVKLWDAASGELIVSFDHQANVFHGAFSPDGARILTASADNAAKLWDAASGKLVASFEHRDTVRWAAFSPDGTRILTASVDKTAKLWDAATPVALARQVSESGSDAAGKGSSDPLASSPALQVESLSDLASGLQFSDDGSLVAVDEERRSKLTTQLKDSAPDPGTNTRFIRWFFSSGADRTIFPASDTKVIEWVDNALLTNPNVTEEWVRNALVSFPDHPLLHIALAGFETDSKRADFLRSFGLARLPKNSVVCTRAGEMLLAQQRPELALAAVDKALLVDPTDIPARRLRLEIQNAMAR
jgi:WD40 repeat protein/serine/threonine protein kinase/ribose 1,5-bisphosphokinase PhnN